MRYIQRCEREKRKEKNKLQKIKDIKNKKNSMRAVESPVVLEVPLQLLSHDQTHVWLPADDEVRNISDLCQSHAILPVPLSLSP